MTFALVLSVSLFINGAHQHTDELIVDSNLTLKECSQLMYAYNVNAQTLNDEMSIHHTIGCEREK